MVPYSAFDMDINMAFCGSTEYTATWLPTGKWITGTSMASYGREEYKHQHGFHGYGNWTMEINMASCGRTDHGHVYGTQCHHGPQTYTQSQIIAQAMDIHKSLCLTLQYMVSPKIPEIPVCIDKINVECGIIEN